jgi:hypothetical protein
LGLLLVIPVGRGLAGQYQVAFWRELGAYENQAPPAGGNGGFFAHVHVWDERGVPLGGRKLYTSWGVYLGATDADGYLRTGLYRPNGYDFQVREQGHTSETTPVLQEERGPNWGQYSFEIGFVFRADVSGSVLEMDLGTRGAVNASGSDPCADLSTPHTGSLAFTSGHSTAYCGDQYDLGTWDAYHGQSFVATANRVLATKAFVTLGAGVHFNFHAQILEGGPSGSPVGPSVTSRTLVSGEYHQVLLRWNSREVQVVPGRTYFLKVWRDGGLNTWVVPHDNYPDGHYHQGALGVPSAELMGLVVCGDLRPIGPTGSLQGVVRNAAGQPLPGTRLDVLEAGLYTLADLEGAYAFPELPVGSYTVRATKSAYVTREVAEVRVEVGANRHLDFNLEAFATTSGPIEGRVVDGWGRPVAGARVTAWPSGAASVTAADGTYRLGPVAFGQYEVTASAAGAESASVSRVLVTNVPGPLITVPLRPEFIVNGNFESGFSGGLARGWQRFPASGGPAYVDERDNRRGGSHGQRWWTSYATHDAGVWQRVKVSPGRSYRVKAWTWRSDEWNNGSANEEMWVGLDPQGGNNPASSDVRWSQGAYSYQTWTPQEVGVVATGNTLTVFVRGKAHWAGSAMQAIVDDLALDGPPAGVDDLQVTLVSGLPRLGWSAAPGALAYLVERSLQPLGPFDELATVEAWEDRTYTDRHPPGTHAVYYRVTARNHAGRGLESAVVSAVPDLVSLQVLPGVEPGTLVLRWNTSVGDRYQVEACRELESAPWSAASDLLTAAGTELSWNLPPQPGVRFFRVVRNP